MSAPHTFTVDLGTRSYPILIGGDLLGSASTYTQLPRAASALIVSNTTVAPLYAAQLQAALQAHYPIRFIAGHEEIAPGRKQDPGAGFEWLRLHRAFDL